MSYATLKPDSPMSPVAASPLVLEASGLHRFFRRGGEEVAALRDVSITLEPGEIVTDQDLVRPGIAAGEPVVP